MKKKIWIGIVVVSVLVVGTLVGFIGCANKSNFKSLQSQTSDIVPTTQVSAPSRQIAQDKPNIKVVIDGKAVEAPGDSTVEMTVEEKDINDKGNLVLKTETHAKSTGIKTRSDKAATEFKTTAPTLKTDKDGAASADAGDSSITAQLVSGSGGSVLIWIGAFCVIGGVIVAFLPAIAQPVLGFAISVVGGALILCGIVSETNPWAFVVAFFLIVGLVLYFLWEKYHAENAKVALKAVVAGVQNEADAPADSSKTVVEHIADAAKNVNGFDETAVVKSVVSKIKADL